MKKVILMVGFTIFTLVSCSQKTNEANTNNSDIMETDSTSLNNDGSIMSTDSTMINNGSQMQNGTLRKKDSTTMNNGVPR